jgi:hypothetical protein
MRIAGRRIVEIAENDRARLKAILAELTESRPPIDNPRIERAPVATLRAPLSE